MILTRRNIIFIAVSLALAGLFYVYYKYYYKEPVYWEQTFEEDRKDPYGTFILFQLLNEISGNTAVKKLDNPVSQFLKRQSTSEHANYVFVGDVVFFDSTNANSIYEFARNGNDVFIAANTFPDELNRKLFEPGQAPVYNDYQQTDTIAAPADSTAYDNDLDSLKTDPDTIQAAEDETSITDEGEVESTDYSDMDTVKFPTDTTAIEPELYFPIKTVYEDSILRLRFKHPAFRKKAYSFQYIYDFKPENYSWSYFNDTVPVLNNISKEILAEVGKDRPVFYRFKVGKGHIYYHALPLTFTNLYLKQRAVLEYANNVFSYLKPGVVYWDNYHKTFSFNDSSGRSKTPLKYILSQPALAWAWYMALAGIAIYMLFFTKRKQRIIPLIEPNTNTSIEFVETLSLMYLKSNVGKIAEVKAKNLRIFIWERYKISSDLPLEEYADKVSAFSGIEKTKVTLIFVLLKNLQYDYASKDEFLEYHRLIEYFHKNCK